MKDKEIKFTRENYLFRPKQQGEYPIQERDWKRLKRLISKIIPHRKIFEIFASVFFSTFASAILSLIAFKSASGLPEWVIPTTWAVLISSFILGIALLVLDKQQTRIISVTVESVLEEMEIIEGSYSKPEIDDELKI